MRAEKNGVSRLVLGGLWSQAERMRMFTSVGGRPLVTLLLLLLCGAWTRAAEAGKHCFWEVKGEQGTLYLLGSIHFLKPEFYPLDPVIEEAFDRSEVVVFEADLAELKNPAAQIKFATQGLCPAGKTLKDYVSAETYAALQARLKEGLGGGGALFDRLRPWMAAMTLVVVELQKLGFNPEHGVDQYFHRKATKAEKRIEPLETVDFQMNLFANLPPESEDGFLRQTLDEVSSFKDLFGRVTAAWKSGDAAALDELIVQSMREHPKVLELFLIDRNKRWVPKLEGWMNEKKPVFAVVGAGHLVGTNSVVDLMRKQKGLTVRQL